MSLSWLEHYEEESRNHKIYTYIFHVRLVGKMNNVGAVLISQLVCKCMCMRSCCSQLALETDVYWCLLPAPSRTLVALLMQLRFPGRVTRTNLYINSLDFFSLYLSF